MSFERRIEPFRSERFRNARQQIASRLRSVCADMPTVDFDNLLDRMAHLEIKYEQRAHANLIGLRDALIENRTRATPNEGASGH